MVEQDLLFLLLVEGTKPLVSAITSAELLKFGSAEKNKERIGVSWSELAYPSLMVYSNKETKLSDTSDQHQLLTV